MSTRVLIAVQNRTTGAIRAVYCHNGGDDLLPGLVLHYEKTTQRTALMALGALSQLGEEPGKPPQGHSFDTPVHGYCVAYHRDRGEPLQQLNYSGISALMLDAPERDAEFVYLYQFGEWTRTVIRHD